MKDESQILGSEWNGNATKIIERALDWRSGS
jgi:hypothetical protein